RVLLELRLRSGLARDALAPSVLHHVPDLVSRGLIVDDGSLLVLTLQGRLLADAVVRQLT
ncbi:MAG: coproporphyrinogen oxidase, partial [Nocardioidaceae bacterium]|nr:coproporphyrinogen oxidase [Nocardioidaceae bacterium]